MKKMTTDQTEQPTCAIDTDILNNDTIASLTDIGLTFFAPLCGRNRGVFVLDPTDGNAWSCTSFPPTLAQLAGAIDTPDLYIKDANAVKQEFLAGNLSARDAVSVLDYYVKRVYLSSSDVDKDVYGCEMSGLAKLSCSSNTAASTNKIIRSVTMAGVFTPAPYVTDGKVLTLTEAKTFYTVADFQEMKDIGLNTVQIPFPVHSFEHYDTEAETIKYLTIVLRMIKQTGLKAILQLVGEDNDDAIAAAAHYCVTHHLAVMAMTVPSIQSITAARAAEANLTLIVPINESDLKDLTFPDNKIYAGLNLDHTTSIGDIASSTSQDDRMKMYYHESKSCIYRSPIEFAECYRNVPLFITSGFDLAIDNCHTEQDPSKPFVNYGQCDRFNETIYSGWWQHHRTSFAARQLASYEKGMGWSYAAWKLYNDDEEMLLDSPAKLLAFKNVYAANLIPSLTEEGSSTMACLNPPLSDFVMGDATYSPTPAPPPDCGYGWWNYTINDCSYWIPPVEPPTDPPTFMPSMEPIVCPQPLTTKAQIKAGTAGALVATIVCIVSMKFCRGRRDGYNQI